MDRYRHAVTSTQRFLNSIYDEIIVLLLAYTIVLALLFYLSPDLVPHGKDAKGQRWDHYG